MDDVKFDSIIDIIEYLDESVSIDLMRLAKFYRYQLMESALRMSADDESDEDKAWRVISYVSEMPTDIRDSFSLISLSYEWLKHLNKKGRRQTIKAEKARRNFRRCISLPVESDLIEQEWQRDKTASRESFIVFHDPVTGYTINAEQQRRYRKIRQRDRDGEIAECVNATARECAMTSRHVTLTLEGEWHRRTYEDAKHEIDKRFRAIRRRLARQNVRLIGSYAIEHHRNETPHIHAILNIYEDDIHLLENEIDKEFLPKPWISDDDERADFQEVYDDKYLIYYLLKKVNSTGTDATRGMSFIGLRRDIKSLHGKVREGTFSYVPLSIHRISKAQQAIRNKWKADILPWLRGFLDDEFNITSVYGHEQPILNRYRKNKEIICLLIYKQECVAVRIVHVKRHEIEQSRGQPPPDRNGLNHPRHRSLMVTVLTQQCNMDTYIRQPVGD